MPKRKSRSYKVKPLLATTGILHLQNSFVLPTEERKELQTVSIVNECYYGYCDYLRDSPLKKAESECQIKPNEKVKKNVFLSTVGECSNKFEFSNSNYGYANVSESSTHEWTSKSQSDIVNTDGTPQNGLHTTVAENDLVFNPNHGWDKAKSQGHERTPKSSSEDLNEEGTKKIENAVSEFYKEYDGFFYSVNPNPYDGKPIQFGLPIDITQQVEPSGTSVVELALAAQEARRLTSRMESKAHLKTNAETKSAEEDKIHDEETEANSYDPLPMEILPSETGNTLGINVNTSLEQYWDFVKETPHDFSRWTYLIQYAESTNDLNSCRKVFSSFLPLFPYCFGYWKRYAELEKAHHYFHRALTILQKGLEFIPLSTNLWLSYLNLYCQVHANHADYDNIVRDQYEKALNSAGMEFRSDALWDAFIEWETKKKQIRRVFDLYLRLIQVPTRLYNRHWDNCKTLIRDYHPRTFLYTEEYETLRRKGCKKFKQRYKVEPEIKPWEIYKTSKPEDKLMDYIKEKLLKRILDTHNKCEAEVNSRWLFEDRILRPYFHVKALDKKQLRNWDQYIDFEISEGNHNKIVLLFERCLISCALYEKFWCKYARYLEKYHRVKSNVCADISVHYQKSQLNIEIVSKKETEDEDALIEDVGSIINLIISKIEQVDEEQDCVISEVVTSLVISVSATVVSDDPSLLNVSHCSGSDSVSVLDSNVNGVISSSERKLKNVSGKEFKNSPTNLGGYSEVELPPKSGDAHDNHDPSTGFTSFLNIPPLPPAMYYWQEIVRDVYTRACIVHCPNKPVIRLQWAAFEEELGNIEEARNFIRHVIQWFPKHLDAKLQLIELERRCKNQTAVMQLFATYMSKATKMEIPIIAIKYARFLHKEMGLHSKALAVLRNALKKDKGNPYLYSYVFEICYERFPSDPKGASAALQLALGAKELSNEQKLLFLKKKVLFFQEHGNLKNYRDTLDQLYELQSLIRTEQEEEAIRKEADAKFNAQIVENLLPFPVPTWDYAVTEPKRMPNPIIPIQFEPFKGYEPIHTEEVAQNNNQTTGSFQTVPPPHALSVANYKYGYTNVNYKLAENIAQQEYGRLEAGGYPEEVINQEDEPSASKKQKIVVKYIVAPTGSYSNSYLGGPNSGNNPPVPGSSHEKHQLESPIPLSMLPTSTISPCVNVPDWFVKEGGELCLSNTRSGFSVIRYWPSFLSEAGDKHMFKAIRHSVRWHQKRVKLDDRWRWLPHLVSWLGPCEYSHSGMTLEKNEDWPAVILDLLHRINRLTQNNFNSCSLNLYRSGHDSNAWHSDLHPGLGSNPAIASISLGALRLFEMKTRVFNNYNYIRFPLLPGSLLIMEGATQSDWHHQLPKDPQVQGERINLTFRIMHAFDPASDLNEPQSESASVDSAPPVVDPSEVNDVTKNTGDTLEMQLP